MEMAEKLLTLDIQDTRHKTKTNKTKTQHRKKSICGGHHYAQTNINNLNKTRAFLQKTTADKDKPNIFFMLLCNWTKLWLNE